MTQTFVPPLRQTNGAPSTGPQQSGEALVLQSLCLPDPAISDQTVLFLRLSGGAALEGDSIRFPAAGAEADFGSYMNLLNLETWQGRCRLEGLALRLSGEGRVRLRLSRVLCGVQGIEGVPEETVIRSLDLELQEAGTPVDLGDCLDAPAGQRGLLVVALTALGPARLSHGAFVTPLPDAAPPRLGIVITTFRREAAVAETVARIAGLFAETGAGARIGASAHVFVIDNGQSLNLPPTPGVSVIPNRNLGGAGGFARGLAEAEAQGFSHCLFMDDDASFQMENLIRCFAFLSLATSPKAALAGAMISAGKPWAIWENGARFDRFCRPLCHLADLRLRLEVMRMELATARPKPPGFYGGWWFFAFPLAGVTRHPFPFFVRGDDISFSLANRFDTATLNGVVSFQEDFAAKESAQTLFLDLRNHLHHHLVQPDMEIGAWGTARIALHFLARSIVRMHYDSAEAQLLSWESVMQGPEHFTDNADMTAKRAEIGQLIRSEAWQPVTDLAVEEPQDLPRPLPQLMKLTLNGHLLPFFGRFGRRVRLGIADRALLWPVWGAAELSYVDAAAGRGYTVRHDKARAFGLGLRALRLALRWQRAYPALRETYRARYPEIASRGFWRAEFARGPVPLAAPADPAPASPAPEA